MSLRKTQFVEGEFYHVYIHAAPNLILFKNNGDYIRFLNTLFFGNSQKSIQRLDRKIDLNSVFDLKDEKIDIGAPLVGIICFCLMSNHIHFVLEEKSEGNISIFMHKVLTSFSKYTNLKYERRGHVFESKFHAKYLEDNRYLLRASSYVHLNPKDISQWNKKEHLFKWSSFQDYVVENRWGNLLSMEPLLSQFENSKEDYFEFVKTARRNLDRYEADF